MKTRVMERKIEKLEKIDLEEKIIKEKKDKATELHDKAMPILGKLLGREELYDSDLEIVKQIKEQESHFLYLMFSCFLPKKIKKEVFTA
jgi:hypothetical protein